MKKTNFDAYLQEQMKGPAFAERFRKVVASGQWLVISRKTPRRRKSSNR